MTAAARYSLFFLLLCAAVLAFFSFAAHTAAQASSTPITGYAWSDTIGWIDLNCANAGTCGSKNFGLSVAADGTISGYAWSDNIGWVSAQASDTAGCPSAPCTPQIVSGALQGWLKALSAAGDGWDGWISLSGSGYGPTLSGGHFSGYAWGSDIVGWVSFSLAQTSWSPCVPATTYSCSDLTTLASTTVTASCQTSTTHTACSYQCASSGGAAACITAPSPSFNEGTAGDGAALSGHLQARPLLVRPGNTAMIYWNVSDVQGCTVQGNGDTWSPDMSGAHESTPITTQTTYTLHCTALPTASPSSIDESVTINVIPVFQEL
jgi:hypothetical protein